MLDDPIRNDEHSERFVQCEFDMEGLELRTGRTGMFETIFRCGVCGAGSNEAELLCGPERNMPDQRDDSRSLQAEEEDRPGAG